MTNDKSQISNVKWFFLLILVLAAAFRISVAHWLPNDAPDDGRVYAQISRNMLERQVYSHDSEAPFAPSLIRLPGYPLFLAAIYSVFGHVNNGAVRIVQALIDTATCALIALLAFYWQPDEKKKLASALAALALAAICPFTTIYAATILTEVPTNFLIMAMMVATTIAFRKSDEALVKRALLWWVIAGLLGGLAVLMRPDNGLFLAAVGITLVMTGGVWSLVRFWSAPNRSQSGDKSPHSKILPTFAAGLLFSIAFALVLTPWTIRNWRVFHVFQPLSPAHAEMPGEFVPRGYEQWLRTWLDDDKYIAPFLWSLDAEELDIDEVPASAIDSAEEKARVAALFDKYNHAAEEDDSDTDTTDQDQNEEPENQAETSQANEPPPVEMTPEIDAAFGQLARERIARHRFRYYVWLPIQRARTMWFDTHSQYWPFEGALLPLEDLDYEHHQHIWLPLFAGLTAVYTILGMAGALGLWFSRQFTARRWLLLAALAIFLRLALFSSIENPEPRYLVEFFPFLSILGGIGLARIRRIQNRER
jgi:Dolichyl-phosphate-mannose-protein mannosyltransferase